ncbi:expressed unknown protein [Seminavis robusta]|uniref:Uncharacterized protein n=1 Tax=Seminavis robusta TaxID=568900 RepID=A0A9N8EU28_9STRA|nr:expressed unknown protein [Seminavis robusta]|eukprot:Sro1953_g307520.1 n/a (815) ;mRNA; f:5407-7922
MSSLPPIMAPEVRGTSDLTLQDMCNFLEEISFFSSPSDGMDVSPDNAREPKSDDNGDDGDDNDDDGEDGGMQRGCKRRRVEGGAMAGNTMDVCVPSREAMDFLQSSVRGAPSFRGHAMRLWTVSMGSVQRTISGLTSGLSFLSPRRRTSSQSLSSSSGVAFQTEMAPSNPSKPEDPTDGSCSLHQLMLLDIDSAQAKDFNETCSLPLSPFFGRGSLHMALCKGAPLEVVQDLLSLDPRATRQRDMDGMTPLHLALKFRAPVEEAVLAVLAMDPEVANMQDCYQMKPLDWALLSGVPSESAIVKELEKLGTYSEAKQRRSSWHPMDADKLQPSPLSHDGMWWEEANGSVAHRRSCPEIICEKPGDDNDSKRNGEVLDLLLDRCHEQTKWIYSKVLADLKQVGLEGNRGRNLESQHVERLSDMSFLFRSLSLQCDGLAPDSKADMSDPQKPRRKSSCDTVEASNTCYIRKHSSAASTGSGASGESAAPSLEKTVDTTLCSQSTETLTALNPAGSVEDNDSIESNPGRFVDIDEPHRVSFVRWCESEPCDRAGSPPPNRSLGVASDVNTSNAALQTALGKIESKRLLPTDVASRLTIGNGLPGCLQDPPLPPLPSLRICQREQTTDTGTSGTVEARHQAKPSATSKTESRPPLTAAVSLQHDKKHLRLPRSQSLSLQPGHQQAHQFRREPMETERDASSTTALDETHETKKLRAHQASIKAQKTTSGKLKVIMEIMNNIGGPPSTGTDKAGPRRYYFRVQKIVRCLHGCYGGNVEAFCETNPKLDVSRYKCPNGHDHRTRKGMKSVAGALSPPVGSL